MVEVDTEFRETAEKKDPTGGRGVNGEIGGKLEAKDHNEQGVLESAV